MAPKLLLHLHRILRNTTTNHHIPRNRRLNPTLSSLHSRFFSDMVPLRPQPVSTIVDPSSTKPPPPPSSSYSNSNSSKINGNKAASSSLNELELAKFAAIAETWWDAEGPFKPLHVMNPTRLAFIRSTLCRHFGKNPYCPRPFEGLRIADVGCGGGILSEKGSRSTHFCCPQTLEAVKKICPKQALLVGMTHEFDHHRDNEFLMEWSNRNSSSACT